MNGPRVCTDIVEVYVFRRPGARGESGRGFAARLSDIEFLQLRRCQGVMAGSWQPVMGHVREGETATQAAVRELQEETGYSVSKGLVGLWQLELVNTYLWPNKML